VPEMPKADRAFKNNCLAHYAFVAIKQIILQNARKISSI
jgi:hypothetical protein